MKSILQFSCDILKEVAISNLFFIPHLEMVLFLLLFLIFEEKLLLQQSMPKR